MYFWTIAFPFHALAYFNPPTRRGGFGGREGMVQFGACEKKKVRGLAWV
jgi:hypothetical protein